MKGGITRFPGERIVSSFPKNKLSYEKKKKKEGNQLFIISILIMALKTNILFTHFLAH